MRYFAITLFAAVSVALAVAQQDGEQMSGGAPELRLQETSTAQQAAENQSRAGAITTLDRALRSVELDGGKVFHVREATLDRGELHLYLTDGTIAFSRDIEGRVTAAYFEGEGEVLMRPPDLTERASLGLFSGVGVLDEQFSAAYLRFNGDMESELKPYLRESEEQQEFIQENGERARTLAGMDAMRLLESFTEDPSLAAENRFLHARLATRLGTLDVYDDSQAEDQLKVECLSHSGEESYLDVWMAFPGREARELGERRVIDPAASASAVEVENFKIDTTLTPPEALAATAELDLAVRSGGQRLLVFELSRWLRVSEVSVDGVDAEFLQNEALKGSELARIGNDMVTVVMPATLRAGEHHRLRFRYAGAVMQQAAPGLLYVGARGTWYPNRGMHMSHFDLTFHWPKGWTLVATGEPMGIQEEGDTQVGEWRSEQGIPLAGFNLGKFEQATAHAGAVEVSSYSTGEVEKALANATPELAAEAAEQNRKIAQRSADAITKYAQWFGPYPYKSLALTQMPGGISQGWPTLVYLSSLAYLSDRERQALKLDELQQLIYGGFMQDHETAHQWWGDRVGWSGYRDQWLMEALSSLSALMIMEEKNPAQARELLEQYRRLLLASNAKGRRLVDAGPVTLGYRLSSSVFPDAYIPVTYGRGLWLMVMLRDYFADYEAREANGAKKSGDGGFLEALREFGNRYEYRTATADDFRKVLEEFLPKNARFEGARSLKWFFDGWVQGSSVPQIDLEHVTIRQRGTAATASFTIRQQQCPESLVTSVPIFAELAGGRRVALGRVFADGHESEFELKVPAGTRHLLADPEKKLLRQ